MGAKVLHVEESEEGILAQVVHLLNLTVVISKDRVQCQMCGVDDHNHTTSCPIPGLEDWLATQ